MNFDKARLVDEEGNEYQTSSMYSTIKNENLNIEFQGDLSNKKGLTLIKR